MATPESTSTPESNRSSSDDFGPTPDDGRLGPADESALDTFCDGGSDR